MIRTFQLKLDETKKSYKRYGGTGEEIEDSTPLKKGKTKID